MRSGHRPGESAEASILPGPRGHSWLSQDLVPGLLPGGVVRILNHPSGPTLTCVCGTHTACLGGPGPREVLGLLKSHTANQGRARTQDPVAQTSVSISEFLSFITCPSRVLPPPCSHLLPCLLVSCRDTKASWDPSGLQDQRAKRWVLVRGRQLLPDIQAGRSKPLGAVPREHGRFIAGSPLLISRRPGGRSQ